jgi:HAMP domain-containing protein
MKIMAKFNAVLLSVFLVGLLIAGFVSHSMLHGNARDEVIKHADLMMSAALAIRGYTIREIKPLLVAQLDREFLPQTVPSYAATNNFHTLHKNNPEYMYKEATLNPTNPRDKAMDWESDIIWQFRNDAKLKQIVGERETPTGPSLYLARPIQITNEGCLACHSTVDRAPATMIELYGTANGFGWKRNEIVGSQIVSVPLSVPVAKANRAFVTFMASLVAIFAALFALINLMLRRMILRPVNAMAEIADKVSKGKLDVPEFDTRGEDEISALSQSFNRMRVSLEKAMKMLGD